MTSLDKRHALENERKTRIFDAKARTMGVDKNGLNAQIQEKMLLTQLEKDRDEFFNSQTVMMDQHAVYLAEQNERAKLNKAVDVEDYRKRFQKKQAAREWDLNDPKRVEKDLPARISDNDPRCGAASMQRFHGEDLDQQARKRAQAQQMRNWTEDALQQKQYKEYQEHEFNRKMAERADELNFINFQLEKEKQKMRSFEAKANCDFNRLYAAQKRREEVDAKKKETLDNFEEIRNALDSDLLTENPTATLSVNDPYRFKPYHMKGLLPEHRQAILNEQASQRDELKMRKEKEAEDERQWDLMAKKTNAMFGALDNQRTQERAKARQKLAQEWQQQAAEQTHRKEQLEGMYHTPITEEFFGKFNTSTR